MVKDSKKECDQCIQFGICLESCMVAKSGKPTILSELTETSRTGAWNCVNCWNCIDVCPMKVDIYGIMMDRRRKEDIPELIKQCIDNISHTGCAMNLRGINHIREMYCLKPFRMIKEKKVKILLENESTMNGKTEKIDKKR